MRGAVGAFRLVTDVFCDTICTDEDQLLLHHVSPPRIGERCERDVSRGVAVTEHDSDDGLGAEVADVVVTEKMLEAGEDVVLCVLGGVDLPSSFCARELADRVERAMADAHQ
jgi:hypothetical protein